MQLQIKTKNGKIFDSSDTEMLPDENGIIKITIGERQRIFVYQKLISYLERNGSFLREPARPKIKNPKKPKPVKIKKEKQPRIKKPNIVRGKYGQHRKKPVIAKDESGKEIPFDSVIAACDTLNIHKKLIHAVLNGDQQSAKGYMIKYAC